MYVPLQEVTVVKRPGEKLGMSIKGGVKNFPGDENTDEGIFISRVCFPRPPLAPSCQLMGLDVFEWTIIHTGSTGSGLGS